MRRGLKTVWVCVLFSDSLSHSTTNNNSEPGKKNGALHILFIQLYEFNSTKSRLHIVWAESIFFILFGHKVKRREEWEEQKKTDIAKMLSMSKRQTDYEKNWMDKMLWIHQKFWTYLYWYLTQSTLPRRSSRIKSDENGKLEKEKQFEVK